MFLSLDDFLNHFRPAKERAISRNEFIKNFKIMYNLPLTFEQALSKKPFKLTNREGKVIVKNPLIKDAKDPRNKRDEIIDYFYQILITYRYYYLEQFYNAYFKFANPYTMNWDPKLDILLDENTISLQKNDASRKIIRNLFYLELLHLTKVTNTIKSQISFWAALENLYNKFQLEDRFFAPSSIGLFLRNKTTQKAHKQTQSIKQQLIQTKPPHRPLTTHNPTLNYNNLFYLLQSYQPKASIINPYTIFWILSNLVNLGRYKDKRIFTPVLSWGSYLVAFMHLDKSWKEYVGVDVMKSVCQKVEYLGKYYNKTLRVPQPEKKVTIYCQPSEWLAINRAFLEKYDNYFDVIMICPPYYNMEVYHEGEQSTEMYPTYEQWLEKYWEQTVKLCYRVLNKKGYFMLIINNYNSLDGTFYPLIDDLSNIVKKHKFRVKKTYYLMNRTSPLRTHTKDRTEQLIIFKKDKNQ